MVVDKAIPLGGTGNRIKIYVALLPIQDRTEPKDTTVIANGSARYNGQVITVTTTAQGEGTETVTINDGAGITVGATSITVDALLRELPIGTALIFNAGLTNQTSTTTTALAAAGATSISVVATTGPIADNEFAIANVAGETSIDVAATLADLENGTEILFNEGAAQEQVVTLTAAALTGATSLTVAPLEKDLTAAETGSVFADTVLPVQALTGAIAGGTPLVFNRGATNQSQVVLTEDVGVGDTEIKFKNLVYDISAGDIANYVARLQLLGGTGSGVNISPNREGIQFFEDELGFEDAAITNGTWTIPFSGAFVPRDIAYLTVKEGARQSPRNGREVWVWVEEIPGPGQPEGNRDKGASVITDFAITLSSSAIQTVGWTFSGNGSILEEFNEVPV